MTNVTQPSPALVLFRDDLRLSDNPAVHAAASTQRPLLCVYVFDEISPHVRPLGGAARWWLHGALASLAEHLKAAGARLDLVRGATAEIIEAIVAALDVESCFWNRRYGAAERAADAACEAALVRRGVRVHTFNGSLLHEPSEVRSKTGTAFKVFTPFLRASLALGPTGHPVAAPNRIDGAPAPTTMPGRVALEDLALRTTAPDWAAGLRATWAPGEPDGQQRLHAFIASSLPRYGEERNVPGSPATSGLSAHLRHGTVSPRQVVAQAWHVADRGDAPREEVDKFVSEVIWRDFSYNILVEHPDLATRPIQPAFEHFPYKVPSAADLRAWKTGRTGYPIVDAGMRQLWATGFMHNRVRMITASFLIKHLLTDWRVGERWFWDTLCDADPASNPSNWQWVAGCGADAAPYFRIFNPTLQGEKFDPQGAYVRTHVPELAALPAKWLHRPWEAPPDVLTRANVVLGTTYPRPIVEHEPARDRALRALATMRTTDRTP